MNPVERMLLTKRRKRDSRTAKLNEFAFKEPLSPLGMYFLGILYTDGCLWKESINYRLQLGLIDYDVIDKFIEFLKYEGNTHIENKKSGTPRKIVQITSETLGLSLVNLGITPAKTHTIEAPKHIVENRDFWRGVIDGDGCLTINGGHSFSILLRTASEKFADQYIEFAAKNDITVSKCNDGCYQLTTYGSNAHKLDKLLYKDCCFAMKRKLDIYLSQTERLKAIAHYWARS